MRTVPGVALRGMPLPTRVLCPQSGCGKQIASLPDGVSLALRGVPATGSITGTCSHCGADFDVKTVEDDRRG